MILWNETRAVMRKLAWVVFLREYPGAEVAEDVMRWTNPPAKRAEGESDVSFASTMDAGKSNGGQ